MQMNYLSHCTISGIAAIVAITAAIAAITFAKMAMRRCDLSDARLLATSASNRTTTDSSECTCCRANPGKGEGRTNGDPDAD